MEQASRRRVLALAIALAVVASLTFILSGALTPASAEDPLPDRITLSVIDDEAIFSYGAAPGQGFTGSAKCDQDTDDSIMAVSAVLREESGGSPVETEQWIGVVGGGIGVADAPNGNAQACGRIDEISDTAKEALTLSLGTLPTADGATMYWVDLDLFAKFDAMVKASFFDDGTEVHTETLDLSDNGSDSGPDSKFGAKYRFVIVVPEGFDTIELEAVTGGTSLQGGEGWPFDVVSTFGLDPLLCGEVDVEGGPDYEDTPRAAFQLGQPSKDVPCLTLVDITSSNTIVENGEQSVEIAPALGFTLEGMTGLGTIEWDVETPSGDSIPRSYVRTDSGDVVIPWCEEEVRFLPPSADWWYTLIDPASKPTYDLAVPDGFDLCLVKQETTAVDIDDTSGITMRTQTVEVYYFWNDPLIVRK